MKKNVLITGATGGIGEEICKVFSRDYRLIVLGRNKEKLSNLKKKYDSIFHSIVCDLDNQNEIKLKIEAIDESVDILVNNAGITDDSIFLRMTDEKWSSVINTNLNSTFFLTNLIVKKMIKQKWGRIINITSVVGHTGNFGQSNYCASKAAIIGMSKSIALELAKRNITVNCISPGFIETSMTNVLSAEQKELILNKIPMAKIGEPQDVANCVFYLASEGAKYITGETIHVNGGMLMT